jgi:hypothetical protein
MRLLFIICCLLPVTALAEKEAKRTCRILFLAAPSSAPQKLFLFDGKVSQEVNLPRMNFSQVYEIAGGNVRLYLLPAPVVKAEEIPAAAPQAVITEDTADCYLILRNDPANPVAPARMQVVNAGQDRFRNGQMLWFNLTTYQLAGVIGSESLRMKSNSRTILNAPASSASAYRVKIGYITPEDQALRPICETQWQFNPATRMVMFVFEQADEKVPRVMGFSDFRIAKPERPASP